MQRYIFKVALSGAILFILFSAGSVFAQHNGPLRDGETLWWSAHAGSLRDRIGERFTFVCPPNGTLSLRVWGTDVYTYDSSICSAAVHAGVITVAGGGTPGEQAQRRLQLRLWAVQRQLCFRRRQGSQERRAVAPM
jgi:hypothetical protein